MGKRYWEKVQRPEKEKEVDQPASLQTGRPVPDNHYFFCQQYGSRQISADVCIVQSTRQPERCKGCERNGGAT